MESGNVNPGANSPASQGREGRGVVSAYNPWVHRLSVVLACWAFLVVCMGGTIRSHLGILTREFGVPCLMAATLDGLKDGDSVSVEYSKPAADAYANAETAAAQRARIIKTS